MHHLDWSVILLQRLQLQQFVMLSFIAPMSMFSDYWLGQSRHSFNSSEDCVQAQCIVRWALPTLSTWRRHSFLSSKFQLVQRVMNSRTLWHGFWIYAYIVTTEALVVLTIALFLVQISIGHFLRGMNFSMNSTPSQVVEDLRGCRWCARRQDDGKTLRG